MIGPTNRVATDPDIAASEPGMAHFSGTGPAGRRCSECLFWLPIKTRSWRCHEPVGLPAFRGAAGEAVNIIEKETEMTDRAMDDAVEAELKYEAELQARTPEQWEEAWKRKAEALNDITALARLMWPRDYKELQHLARQAKDAQTLSDRDYLIDATCELADRLREARDHPEIRERERWEKLMLAAAMIGSRPETAAWLNSARDDFSSGRVMAPADDAPLIEVAAYTVECLLDALLMAPEQRQEIGKKMRAKIVQIAGEAGVRMGTFVNGEFVLNGEVVPFEKPEKPTP